MTRIFTMLSKYLLSSYLNCKISFESYIVLMRVRNPVAITKAKSYVPIITLSTQDNAKFIQLKSGYKWIHVFL